jgi:hypothetical protein
MEPVGAGRATTAATDVSRETGRLMGLRPPPVPPLELTPEEIAELRLEWERLYATSSTSLRLDAQIALGLFGLALYFVGNALHWWPW